MNFEPLRAVLTSTHKFLDFYGTNKAWCLKIKTFLIKKLADMPIIKTTLLSDRCYSFNNTVEDS